MNKPIDVNYGQLFSQVDIELPDDDLRSETVYFGGPVLVDRGFVLHQPLHDWNSTLKIDDDTGLTTSRDVLGSHGRGKGPQRVMVTRLRRLGAGAA